jgi:hypothetical protein
MLNHAHSRHLKIDTRLDGRPDTPSFISVFSELDAVLIFHATNQYVSFKVIHILWKSKIMSAITVGTTRLFLVTYNRSIRSNRSIYDAIICTQPDTILVP